MKKEEMQSKLSQISFKAGQLHKLVDEKKIFWVEGPNPNIVQYMTDDEENVVKEYISGKNGHEQILKDTVLLFIGLDKIKVTTEDEDQELLEEDYIVLKWLFGSKILFWTVDGLDGVPGSKLENIFDVVGEQEIPDL